MFYEKMDADFIVKLCQLLIPLILMTVAFCPDNKFLNSYNSDFLKK